jgi:putative MFS transporter
MIGVLSLIYATTGGVMAMLSPYTAEVFPTRLRGTGSGLSAGSTKLGGLFGGFATVTGVIAVAGGLARPVLLVSIPWPRRRARVEVRHRDARPGVSRNWPSRRVLDRDWQGRLIPVTKPTTKVTKGTAACYLRVFVPSWFEFRDK